MTGAPDPPTRSVAWMGWVAVVVGVVGIVLSWPRPVRCGIDVLQDRGFVPLVGQRVGLITNHTGIDANGRRTVDVLREAPEVELVALFSPEHGFEGRLDEEGIESTTDDSTSLVVHSLYGETRRPTPAMLENLDVLVFDVQDVGVRCYTYVSTMGLAMEAAAEAGLAFIVLDRPNPLGGRVVAGPMLASEQRSFVAYHEIPHQHGMTVGELARLFRAERDLELDLHVVPMEHWERRMRWPATRLPWIAPSPNLPTLESAEGYPDLALLETTNVSVGRGTDMPFEGIGAPWMDAGRVRAAVARTSRGIGMRVTTFTPSTREFAGESCSGLEITSRGPRPLALAAHLLVALHEVHPETFVLDDALRLVGDARTLAMVREGASAEDLLRRWEEAAEAFRERRLPYELYR